MRCGAGAAVGLLAPEVVFTCPGLTFAPFYCAGITLLVITTINAGCIMTIARNVLGPRPQMPWRQCACTLLTSHCTKCVVIPSAMAIPVCACDYCTQFFLYTGQSKVGIPDSLLSESGAHLSVVHANTPRSSVDVCKCIDINADLKETKKAAEGICQNLGDTTSPYKGLSENCDCNVSMYHRQGEAEAVT
jgi:hypothetical protein